jgi:alkylation response protein AidB-like acyl-CoA dehydrogenase
VTRADRVIPAGGEEEADPAVFRHRAREWLAANRSFAPSDYGPIVPEAEVVTATAWQARIFAAGLAGLHWPRAVGGQGLTRAHHTVWMEECARAEVPPFLNMVGLVLTAEGLLRFGTEDQQAAHLPHLAAGTRLWCQLFSEPGAGSDLAHLSTRAERDGSGWRLEGQKVWCSNGRLADWGICLARTDPAASAHAGLSFFLVDMHAPGVTTVPLRQLTGRAEFDQVSFDDVALPAEALLGPAGGGWAVAMATLTNERDHVGAMAINLGHRLDSLVRPGDPGPGRSATRDRLVGQWVRGRATVELASQVGRLGPAGASLMKLSASGSGFDMADLGTRLQGAGAMLDGPAADAMLSAPATGIAGGTTEVQKNIIGERLLGLPKEPATR